MGLAGVKQKQRISADPNNLTWSNDQSKFGFRMLQKMGWAPGKGLGVNEDGNQEHVKIRLKEDNLGLGANKKTSDNWLDNTDSFSRLLADLNARTESASATPEPESDEQQQQDDEKSSKKRKRSSSFEDDNDKSEKKKKKKDKKDKSEKKKDKKKDKKDKSEKKKDKKKSKDKVEEAPAQTVLRNA
ncbi:G-patch-domain-containing protein [Lichtheimia hyalospora FSU 10163]|nr:G-patch-domain-containing protein [Lichtheimia hyalospora FSU 10163]